MSNVSHGRSAFSTMLGGCLGVFVALILVIMALIGLGCTIIVSTRSPYE